MLLQGTPALCTLNHDRTFHADAFEVCSSHKSYVFKGSTSEAVTKCQPIPDMVEHQRTNVSQAVCNRLRFKLNDQALIFRLSQNLTVRNAKNPLNERVLCMEARGVEPLSEDNDNTSFYGCSYRFDVTLETPCHRIPFGSA